MEERRRAEQAQEQVIFSTQIENSVIANMSEIGVYPYAVYSVIKMHQASGEDNPSYATIARMTGINRSTVIKSVRKLTLQRHFGALAKFAHVESRFHGRKRRGKGAFDTPLNPCVRSACSTTVAVGINLAFPMLDFSKHSCTFLAYTP